MNQHNDRMNAPITRVRPPMRGVAHIRLLVAD